MRVLVGLTYYAPHLSGLTLYARSLARELVRRGHTVTVLTTRHDRSLARREELEGVEVVRVTPLGRIGKGPLLPTLPFAAARELARADVLHLHLPQLEATVLAAMAERRGVPLLVTYHCDIVLPPGWLSRPTAWGLGRAHDQVLRRSRCIAVSTDDYAERSERLRPHLSRVVSVLPPIVRPSVDPGELARLRSTWCERGGPAIAFVGRFAAEKGIPVLIRAFRRLLREHPEASLWLAGEGERVVGESEGERVRAELEGLGRSVRVLGRLTDAELAALYHLADVLVVPSTNSTESFGLVQAEAMLCGTPVVASDLPGVRVPVGLTGMGRTAPPGDPDRLAAALSEQLRAGPPDEAQRRRAAELFDLEGCVDRYEELLGGVREP